MEELKIMCEAAETKLAMNGKELQRPEMNRGPDQETPEKLHEGDLYLCAESLNALEGALGGVCEAVDTVFSDSGAKRAFVAVRPPGHHCSASYPSGFCWVNNVHVGIMHAILSHGLTHAAIIDFDLHHGDGSQSIAWQHNARSIGLAKNAAWWKKTSIGYFSLHDINSYPCEMGDEEKVKNASLCIDNAHGQTIWNVHLQPWKSEAEFWEHYESKYYVLLEKTRSYLKAQTQRLRSSSLKSKAAIFLSAGLDASEWESAGMQRHNVNVPTEFYARLTRDVVRIAAEEGTSVEGRIISVLEGGYSDRALYSGILSHLSGLAGDDSVATKEDRRRSMNFDLVQRADTGFARKDDSASERGTRPYEPMWWAASELEKLDLAVQGTPVEPKKPRNSTPPNFSSPTQSSTAKINVAARKRRSMSSLTNGSPASTIRPITPPPPEVPWPIAAHELSKLLVPSDRQTDSCRHEELTAEATRVRRERLSLLPQTILGDLTATPTAEQAPTKMALRERRGKPSVPLVEEDEEKERRNRRKTVAVTSGIGAEKSASRSGTPGPAARQQTRAGRRLSAASTIVSENAEPVMPLPSSDAFRPETAQSVRPESSMSARASVGAPLPVKKSRTVNTTKREAAPKAPRAPKKSPTAVETPASGSASQSTSQSTSSENVAKESVDKLATDMKKIKITLITKEQREARQREREEKERAKSQSESPVVKQEDAVVERPADTLAPVPLAASFPTSPEKGSDISQPSSRPITPATEQRLLLTPTNPHHVPLPMSSPVHMSPAGNSPFGAPEPDVFIPYQPEGPAPSAIPQQQPIQWLPPNTATPLPVRRSDLPVFTSTSAIPFAPRPDAGNLVSPGKGDLPIKNESSSRQSIWDVPETPQK
jgi:histone deacetylase HOS3